MGPRDRFPQGTATVLFTDVEASTALRTKTGDAAAQDVLTAVEKLVRREVATHGGLEIKSLGDGHMVAFDSARQAVLCAIAIQRALSADGTGHPEHQAQLRIGLNSGEVIQHGDDLLGAAVNAAARIVAKAKGGEILISGVVKDLVGTLPGISYASRGRFTLKGFPERWQLFDVLWREVTRRDTANAGTSETPKKRSPRTRRRSTANRDRPGEDQLVGRGHEIGAVASALNSSLEGAGKFILIAGDAGIGKTRLAEQARVLAQSDGMRVLWSTCWEGDAAPPLWPWIQLLRAAPTAATGAGAPSLDSLPGIAELVPALKAVQGEKERLGSELSEFSLFDGVTRFFTSMSQAQPLVLVLDDLHWADGASLRLLEFLGHDLPSRLCVVATYRDAASERNRALDEALLRFPRDALRITLTALQRGEVGELLRSFFASEVGEDAVAALHERTGGNPFFVREQARLLAQDPSLDVSSQRIQRIPLSADIHQLLKQRFERLSQPAQAALGVACVIGIDFDVNVIADVTRLPPTECLMIFDECVRARLIVEAPGTVSGYRFCHALFHEAVYGTMQRDQRTTLHLAVGEALERRHVADATLHLTELAHHFLHALPVGPAEKAVRYAEAAAGGARRVFAYEEAAAHYRAAIRVIDEYAMDVRQLAELLVRLGDVLYLSSLDWAEGIECQQRALTLFESLGDVGRVARLHAAVGRGLASYPDAGDIPAALDHLRTAERLLGVDRAGPELGYLQATIANAARQAMRFEEGAAAAERAMQLGEELGDDRLWITGASFVGAYLIDSGRIAEGLGLQSMAWAKADELNHPWHAFQVAWVTSATLSFLGAPAESLAWTERELGRKSTSRAPVQRLHMLRFKAIAHVLQGELTTGRAVLDKLGGDDNWIESLLDLWGGELEDARKTFEVQLDRLIATGDRYLQWRTRYWLGRIHRYSNDIRSALSVLLPALDIALGASTALAQVLAISTELALCELAQDQLETASGHVQRCRALLKGAEDWRGLGARARLASAAAEAALGRPAEAAQQFEAALGQLRGLGLAWDEAEALQVWSSALERSGQDDQALVTLQQARVIYRTHGASRHWMTSLRASLQRLQAKSMSARTTKATPAANPSEPPEESLFRLEGEFWTLGFGGNVARVKDMRGLHHLAYLLSRPGREVHALDLAHADPSVGATTSPGKSGPGVQSAVVASAELHEPGDAGDLLDEQARDEYRHRLAELRQEGDESEANNDTERAERARTEINFIERELSRAFGLGGRHRKAGAQAERARVSVTLSIRTALKRIKTAHPDLSDHLSATIRTGQYFSYSPDPRVPVRWTM